MYDKFDFLLKKNNTTPYKVSKATGIATATLSDWKNGKSTPKKDKLDLIANFFKVPPSYFDETKPLDCPECGVPFSMPGESKAYHDIQHNKWNQAVEKFGFCWPHSVSENAKAIARTKLERNKNLPYEERINLNIEIFKALFSRSLGASDFSLEHPDFNSYVSMLLYQTQFKKKIESDIYATLVARFGSMPGINEGETFFHVLNKTKKAIPLSKETSFEDAKKLIARNGKNFSTDQKMELIKLLSEIK
jgi:transcriptional regulator with XRE-family HTH domain